ncbi:calretinin-like [Scleropages formosus]|uniref:Calretinin n=1 Tax=Scleropages formosus TaxID=113540 RepID=A0A0P7WMH4_SCLFO|nr:calretinin-like [Scleropages formosus]KPP64848.1 calretinin-like [Scleropages formosus]
MANKAPQPPLHLTEVTASQFLDIWRHFDTDGNGYIEGKELENFFQELEMARRGAGVDPTNASFREKMNEFMQKFDKNADGKIEMSELAQILPTEENFLLCFRQFVGSSAEFMAAWRRYDTDRSGYIEANELKGFLSDLLKKANRHYDDQKLHEYTQTILRMFDLNGDGKLGLSEMARLLPVQENFLLKFQSLKLTSEQFNAIFTFYDKDGNGYIDEQELDALLRDLCEKNRKEIDIQNLTSYKKSIMALSDGGKLYRTELEIVLCWEPML